MKTFSNTEEEQEYPMIITELCVTYYLYVKFRCSIKTLHLRCLTGFCISSVVRLTWCQERPNSTGFIQALPIRGHRTSLPKYEYKGVLRSLWNRWSTFAKVGNGCAIIFFRTCCHLQPRTYYSVEHMYYIDKIYIFQNN